MCGGGAPPPQPVAPPAPAPAAPAQDAAQARQSQQRRMAGVASDQGTLLTGPGGVQGAAPSLSPVLGG